MKHCAKWERYLDAEFRSIPSIELENHLGECPRCARAVSDWRHLAVELREMGQVIEMNSNPDDALVANWLIRQGDERQKPRQLTTKVAFSAAAGLVLLLAMGLFFEGWERTAELSGGSSPREHAKQITPSIPVTVQWVSREGTTTERWRPQPARSLDAPNDGRLMITFDRNLIALGSGGKLRIVDAEPTKTVLELEQGTLACSIEHRPRQSRFIVRAGPFEVAVVGTRFLVARHSDGAVRVAVAKGIVEVTGAGDQRWMLKKGEALIGSTGGEAKRHRIGEEIRRELGGLLYTEAPDESERSEVIPKHRGTGPEKKKQRKPARSKSEPVDGSTPPEPLPPKGAADDQLNLWREWIFQGEYARAERALGPFLEAYPKNREAWRLLASCQRKSRKWQAAISSYRRLIDLASPGEANMARFRCGVILQERLARHSEAVTFFRAYLRTSNVEKPMEAEAMVRLGESLLVLGRKNKAVIILQQVVAKHSGSGVSAKARRLLVEIESPPPGQ